MHATIQKPLKEIINALSKDEKVFVVGCGNCAEKCRSGGEEQAREMKARLEKEGVRVVGYAATASGSSLCKLAAAKKLLLEEHKEEVAKADSFLILACGQGIHTVIDATGGAVVHPGCDTIFGGETVSDDFITEYCSLCGECIVEATGGLCPVTICSKGLLNGPCGGAKEGKCEVDKEQDCGWQLIYDRLKELGKLDLFRQYQSPKNYAKRSNPRSLKLEEKRATFKSLAGLRTIGQDR
ncbi:MAG: methylenetetrahydrofolate reductase C-terminal domain-containing protein [Candidatus Omnitrophica bacterium]|nr:methylenetetrahydrofolate reductase C-terminal domain-containing protein [Candidatus Omnitrophota bacterium]